MGAAPAAGTPVILTIRLQPYRLPGEQHMNNHKRCMLVMVLQTGGNCTVTTNVGEKSRAIV